ncbi:GNAT family N-acetyltransferase [Endozoicomonas sp. SM1973]|uniref:GNAT family N-acetyltransferase n=1 Tax=Spartinivicinus marinus TaxID=2994442 RepID=A0A853I612_9GAMM|nr:GNAT family N-acetyltransferase [Spartinivicinus marinus]MCX4029330.1 GNAT family N-acetyltransferase [Spartinivicinus marinus]NYZ68169.1 GNAT family N-acetyltransferase [Spartinivicinus marinus]
MNASTDNLKLPQGLAIRPAVASDKPFLQSLYHSTRNDLQYINADGEFISELIDQQFQAQKAGYGNMFPNACYFIIEKQQQAIGRITLDFTNEIIHIIDIAFIPEAQGKGYGKGAIQALQVAAGKTCAPLLLSVYANNWTAKNLYLKLGFQIEQSIPPYERMIWYPTIKEMSA